MKVYKMNWLVIIILLLLFTRVIWAIDYSPLEARVEEYLKQAYRLYNNSKFEEAICVYKKALDLKPDSDKVWYWLGKTYYRAGEMDQFFSAWDRFVRLSKEDTTEIRRKMKMYLEQPVFSNSYEHLDTISGNFENPTGVVVDSADNIYISSFARNAILKFSTIGNLLLQFGSQGNKKGLLNKPYGIALDREENIYVTDSGNHRVQKFSPEGNFLMEFGKKGKNPGEFITPEGITLDSEGNIYVVDNGNSRIQVFSKEGKFVGQIGKMGKDKDKLLNPIGIALDGKMDVWIIEQEGKYLKQFDSRGRFKQSFAFPQEKLVPRGITSAPDGKLYISFLEGVIFRFNIESHSWEGVTITSKLANPSALATNQYGLLYVANFDNSSISILMPEEFQKTQFDVLVHRIDTSHYPTIIMPITVSTRDKTPILKLTCNNFKVEENGKWMRPIALGTPVYDNEYGVTTFIIDTSNKMRPYRNDVQKLLNNFVNEMNGGIEAVSIIGFDKKVVQIKDFTRNKTALRDIIENLTFKNTKDKDAIFSAIKTGINKMLNLTCKKAICVISCGDEIEEGTLFKQCIYYAKNNHIPIFIVDYRLQNETNSLKNMANAGLGDYFLTYKSNKAQKLYQTISTHIKNQNTYIISYQTPQEEWSLEWVDVNVSAGHRHLYAMDKIGYLVPEGEGMDEQTVEKIAERIKERKLKQIAEKKLKEEKKKGKGGHKEGGGGGHGEKDKPEGFPPAKEWEEEILINIGEPVMEEFVTEDEADKAAASAHGGGGHGGGH